MIRITKLEGLMNRIESMDEFHDCYVKMLAEAWVANDKKLMKAMRAILMKQMGFLIREGIIAFREENGEMVQ